MTASLGAAAPTARTATAPAPQRAQAAPPLARLRRAWRPHGWTVWYGAATGQCWAAHSAAMVLVCGDGEAELAAAITRFRPGRPSSPPAAVPARCRMSPRTPPSVPPPQPGRPRPGRP
ncbi:hypothetical protein [Streptomonospora salina]|uniref:Uncharacterized protein n=1 Tax=Streptomonospora salina TaxID=104205 RepID=A0A841E613_9ACTN|nr:hypothetical protein [Streptomonospora salina]MBB5996618.1 hypothetical protein [Streptomonospora salina]